MNIRKLPWAALPQALVVPVAILASAGLVLHASAGAFSGSTSNPADSWATGQVVLTDDDGGSSPTTGTAMFSATTLKPGSTGTKCIVVTSQSTVPANVRFYTQAVSTTNGLSTHIDLVVEEGTGGSFANCTGFTPASNLYTGTLATLGTTHTGYANGRTSFAVSGTPGQTRSYRFTYTVNAAAPDTAQNGTAQATFVWEAQST